MPKGSGPAGAIDSVKESGNLMHSQSGPMEFRIGCMCSLGAGELQGLRRSEVERIPSRFVELLVAAQRKALRGMPADYRQALEEVLSILDWLQRGEEHDLVRDIECIWG